ncbi:copper oxidase [Methylomagnum sp.]
MTMFTKTPWMVLVALMVAAPAFAEEKAEEIVEHNQFMDHGEGHLMDMDGAMVMGQNKDKIPPGCDKISEDAEITVHAGHKYAKNFPGTMFGFSEHEWKFKPCTRLTVHFINEDHVRHQWMMHGLPKFMYDKGMFHLEVTGPAKVSGTLILPGEDRTYLVHCDIAQHMEKGMKGQLIVGKGGAPFPSIPGVTDLAVPDNYGTPVQSSVAPSPAVQPVAATPQPPAPAPNAVAASQPSSGAFIFGMILGVFGAPFAVSHFKRHCQGKSASDIFEGVGACAGNALDKVLGLASRLFKK